MRALPSRLVNFLFIFTVKIYTNIKPIFLKKEFSKINLEDSYYKYEAEKLGLSFVFLMDKVSQIRKYDKVFNVWKSSTDFDGKGSMHIAGNKAYCYKVFKSQGIPIPRHVVLKSGDIKGALAFKNKIKSPIVIKPAKDTGDASGVFVKMTSFLSILWAVNYVRIFGEKMIIEEYRIGKNYRLLFCCGKFLSACERMPSFVIGTGVHTIKNLIDLENKDRLKVGDIRPFTPDTRPILYKILITRELKIMLKKQNFKLSSVPEKGKTIYLQPICHWYYGGQYLDVTEKVHPTLIEIARKAVSSAGIKLAGVDIISTDITNPILDSFVINEVNTTPGLLIHYEIQNQKNRKPVAMEILKQYFE
jgi:cyanophycin synthetase